MNDTNTLSKREADSILRKFHNSSMPDINSHDDLSGPGTNTERAPGMKPIMEKTMNSTFYTQKSDEDGEEGGKNIKLKFHSTFNSKNATFTRMKEIKEFKDIKYKKWASNIHAAKLRKLQDKTKARIESQ